MPPKGRRKTGEQPGPDDEKPDWGHADGFPLEEVDVNTQYSGVVTNNGPFGVFVNFGAVKDGLLRIEGKYRPALKKGTEVTGLKVVSSDPEAGKVVLELDEGHLPVPPPKRSASSGPEGGNPKAGGASRAGGGQGSGGSRKTRSQSAGRSRRTREWAHPDATPMADLEVGAVFDGTVTNVSPYGVFVDIGATRDARLSVSAKIGRKFRIGDVVSGCTLESIDVETQRMSVVLDDPEEAVKELPPKERTPVKAAARSRSAGAGFGGRSTTPEKRAAPTSRTKAQKEKRAEPAGKDGEMQLKDLEVGGLVDGVVSNKSRFGVFVDIGCGKDAKLLVPRRVGEQFRRGDEICGMRIEEIDLDKYQITVSAEEPELTEEVDEDDKHPPRRKAAASPAPKAKSKAKTSPKPKAKATGASTQAGKTGYERYKVGGMVDGVVTAIRNQNVLVDVGAPRDALLKLPKGIASQFRVGDEVEGMGISEVEPDEQRLILYLEDPELEASEHEETARKGSSKGKSKGRAPSPVAAPPRQQASRSRSDGAAKTRDWGHAGATPVSELNVGDEVSGYVTNCNKFGVFIDIGAESDGRLSVPTRDVQFYRKGDQVEDLVIDDIDYETGKLSLRIIDEESDGRRRPPLRATSGKGNASRTAASSTSVSSGSRGASARVGNVGRPSAVVRRTTRGADSRSQSPGMRGRGYQPQSKGAGSKGGVVGRMSNARPKVGPRPPARDY